MFNNKSKIVLIVCLFFIGIITGSCIVQCQIKKINDPLNRLNASADKSLSTIFTPASTFYAVMRAMNTEYVDRITPEFEGKMSVDLVKGMLREMGDQNTRYFEPEDVQIIMNAEKGEFEGIGIRPEIQPITVDGIKEEQLMVGSVIPGSNAEKAGLKTGDIITEINGMYVLPYNPMARAEKALNEYRMKPDISKQKELQDFIKSENKRIDEGVFILEAEKKLERGENKTFSLIVKSDGNEKKLNISTGKLSLPVLESKIIDGSKYIKINYISSKLPALLKEELLSTEDVLSTNDALILDLRDVFGGNSKTAFETLSLFVPDKSVFRLNGKKARIIKTQPGSPVWRGKLIVLVNGGTNGCSELMAAALSEYYDNSIIAGTKTSGNFNELSFFNLDNGGGYTITSGQYRTLSNKELKPISPKIFFSPELNIKPDKKFIASVLKENH